MNQTQQLLPLGKQAAQDYRVSMNVTVGSDFIEDYLDSIKRFQIIPTGLMKEDIVWILDVSFLRLQMFISVNFFISLIILMSALVLP